MIYVASSWRNPRQPAVVHALRQEGYSIYDFRNPEPGNTGFKWSEIDFNWQKWSPENFVRGLNHPIAKHGFSLDIGALTKCRAAVLVLPSGRSSHLELGFAAGAGKPVFILLDHGIEPELMYRMATFITPHLGELIAELIKHVPADLKCLPL